MIYTFTSKAPAYGLGYTEGETIDLNETSRLKARPLVPEIAKNAKGDWQNTGRQLYADKEYTVDYLLEAQVIKPAKPTEAKAHKEKKDINTVADENAKKAAELEQKQWEARKAMMK
jgi:hypothetical protein